MKVVNRRGRIATTERWFVRRGMPQAIVNYSATTGIFTRMAPFLVVVFFLELTNSFGDRFSGWGQAGAFIGGVAVVLVCVAIVNKIRNRPTFALPDDIRTPELILFVVAPALVGLIFGSYGAWQGVVVAVTNIIILAVGYFLTRFGLIPMIWWGIVQLAQQLRHLTALLSRSLPLLLLFSAFIFINAEMWQVANDMKPAFFVVIIGMLLSIATGFLALKLPAERDHLARFQSWDEICNLAEKSNAPYGVDQHPGLQDPPEVDPLTKADRINVFLLLLTSQVVQLIVVATSIAVFYTIFGLFAVREETLLQWTTLEKETLDPILTIGWFGEEMILTWELLTVACFIASFAALQFSVSTLTDEGNRQRFFSKVGAEVREILAVRALYRAELSTPRATE